MGIIYTRTISSESTINLGYKDIGDRQVHLSAILCRIIIGFYIFTLGCSKVSRFMHFLLLKFLKFTLFLGLSFSSKCLYQDCQNFFLPCLKCQSIICKRIEDFLYVPIKSMVVPRVSPPSDYKGKNMSFMTPILIICLHFCQ